MTTMDEWSGKRFYRDRDRAVLGGVCAGLAGYLGFNLKVTRILAFIAFLTAMPVAVIAYLAAVFLIPSVSRGEDYVAKERPCRRRRKEGKKKAEDLQRKSTIADDVNRRCQSLDERLRQLEKQVTSKRFQLDQELSRL